MTEVPTEEIFIVKIAAGNSHILALDTNVFLTTINKIVRDKFTLEVKMKKVN